MMKDGMFTSLRRRYMFTCQDVNEFLADYSDGVLAEDLARRYEDHISRCPQCKAYLSQYRTTVDLAHKAGEITDDLPEALVEKTLSFLRKQREEDERDDGPNRRK